MKYFVTQVQARIPKRLEAHFHQDFGMGVANTIMALSLGVEVMHTTVLGVGERSGNAPMEDVVMALKTMYGVDCGIDTTKLTPLAQFGAAAHRRRGADQQGDRRLAGSTRSSPASSRRGSRTAARRTPLNSSRSAGRRSASRQRKW